MTTPFERVAKLSEQELLDHFTNLVARDRRTTAELLVAIAEIDERKLWAQHACSSMFTFCLERFHMSEQVTAKRIWAARTARRFPVVLEMVARGELHLTAIHLLARHLTDENHVRVLDRAKLKSSREVERLVAELSPRADVPSRIRALPERRGGDVALAGAAPANEGSRVVSLETTSAAASMHRVSTDASTDEATRDVAVEPIDRQLPAATAQPARKPVVALSPRRYKIEITVDEDTHDKLRSLQDLLARSEAGRDPAAIISRAIEVLLERTLARKAGCTERPKQPATSPRTHTRSGKPAAAPARPEHRSRRLPAAVRREVWGRDSGRCCYVDACGRRCRATSNLEFHHRKPFAMDGPSNALNIELRCAAHNQFQADLDFGRSFMDARRGVAKRGASAPGDSPVSRAVPREYRA